MEIFNNRELASATLIVLIFIWASFKNESMSIVIKLVFQAFFKKSILIMSAILILYVLFIVYVLSYIDIWDFSQLKNTLLWFFLFCYPQFVNSYKIKDIDVHLNDLFFGFFKFFILIEFLVAFNYYGFFVELMLVSLVSFCVLCREYSKDKLELYRVKLIFDWILILLGLVIFIDSIFNIYREADVFFSLDNFRDFIVPALLSLLLLPFICFFYYMLFYNRVFTKIKIYTESEKMQKYAKWRSFLEFRGKPTLINRWLLNSCDREFLTEETILASIHKFKKQLSESTV